MENAPDQGLFAGLGDSHRQNQRQSAPRAAKEEQLYSANDTYTTTADVPHAQPLLTRAEQIRQNRNQHYDPISWRKMEAQPAPRPPAKYDIQKDPSNIMNTIPSLSRRTPPKQQPQSAYCASTKPLRRIRTDIGAQPRPDHYDHGGVTEYIHPVGVNENAADPSYFHFGRPGAGAPLLHPQTRAIDAHRAGLNRDEKVSNQIQTGWNAIRFFYNRA
ncbi:hypothetical protein DFS34DRAFT_124530 [Phlyctochytrium arcticum]|nr:hypothetical protein DFS34DRAFT_124530 [Phlyctochytrium arcticum]